MNHIKYLFIIFFILFLNSCSKDEKEISYIKETSQDLEMVTAYKEAYKALEDNDPYFAAKKFLDKGLKVHGFDSMNNYYDVNLKKSRLNILKKYKNFTFTKNFLENEKILDNSIKKFNPSIIIHLAAQAGVRYSLSNPDTYLKSNIIGTFNIIKISNKEIFNIMQVDNEYSKKLRKEIEQKSNLLFKKSIDSKLKFREKDMDNSYNEKSKKDLENIINNNLD